MAIALVAALTSCNHKDLIYLEMQKSTIRVAYDWREAPDATATGMCVFFYSLDDANVYYRFDFANTTGGEIEIPQGHYRLITYNNDTELVRFSGTNGFGTHTAYTREADLLEPLYGNGVSSSVKTSNGERVCITPDGLWGYHVTDVVVDRHGVTYTYYPYDGRANDAEEPVSSTDQTITLYPHDMLCHYSYEVRNVENAQYISKVSASLSGMAPTMNMSDDTVGSEHVTLPVSGKADLATNRIVGQFLTFGHSDDTTVPHKMAFYVVMSDGSKYLIEDNARLDVTMQVDNAPDPKHVHIIIDGLKLPRITADESGWMPTVDDWGVSQEDLPV